MAKKNRNLLIYIIIGIALLFGIVCVFTFLAPNSNKIANNNVNSTNLTTPNSKNLSNNKEETIKDYTFIQTITYSDENSTTKIIRNKLLKTATVEFEVFFDENEIETGFMDMRELTTVMFCGLMQMAIYDKNAVNEWNKQVEEWNSQEYTVEDDSPPSEKETAILSPLEGFDVTKVHLIMNTKSKEKISECTITGKEENQLNIIRYYELDSSEDTEE